MKARALLLGLLMPVAIITTSCTKREDLTLAEFGDDEKITIGEFEQAYKDVQPQFLPKASGLEGRKEFLTTMLNKEVMAYKADELGYDKDPAVVQGMDAFERMGLQAGYLKRRVADRITVSREEVEWHHKNKGASLQIRQIMIDRPEEAEQVHALLEDGNDFQTVAREYSKAPDADEGGRVMTMAYGKYAPHMQKVLFDLEVGEFTEPILTGYGYLIIKVVQRTDARMKEDIEENYETLEQEVRVQKEMLESNNLTDEIREHYNVEWYWDALDICFRALPPDRPFNAAPSRESEVYPLLFFDEEDLEKPVVTYAGKTIRIKDFSDYYDQASFFTRPRRDFRLGGIRSFLVERIMADLVVREMKRSGIAEDPEVKKVINAKREELMVQRVWDDLINQQTNVTDREVRDYYNEHREDFKVPEKRRFGVILTGDIESAQKAYEELRGGALFRTVAMAYSIDENLRDRLSETDLLAEGEQPELDEVGFSLPGVGSVSEPFETARGWMILKVTEVEPAGQYTLQEARGSIESGLKNQKNEDRLQELLEKWKEEVGVVIHEDNLEKIEIVERSAEAPGQTAR